ncbi:DUF4012 domain-containing protein [Luteimicrobium subarcticum]|uniref:Uncharacterized protein DUF4012 n=1 Tax=Luteimicrobium subarcticum TaxID=620910 RepID=A0A2M8WVY4_9MICO|nr:DUF4012 domain-containing protein [Luteimicrobium subarcticum]PJI95079.1 uncharacterized protein DUF4012 [Luteimicrobium subarcticum]
MSSDPSLLPGSPSHAARRPPRRRRWVRWVVLGAFVVVVVAVAAAAWTVKGALTARDALTSAVADVPTVEDALLGGDTQSARAALARVQDDTSRARAGTSGPVWAVVGVLPGVGHDAAAFRDATHAVDDLAQDVLPPLVDAADEVDLDDVSLQGGRVDLAPLERAAPQVASAATALDDVRATLDGIDTSTLRPALGDPVATLQGKVASLAVTVSTAHRTTALLPAMLGADGPRTYLLLSMNNAELRSAGGIPGAITVLRADDGKVTVVGDASSGDLGPYAKPVADLEQGFADLYGDQPTRYPQDTTMVPDFPTAAGLLATMWKTSEHQDVDGVVATDPVALSYLLGATGGVTAGPVTLTSDNAVDVLLSKVYAELEDPDAQDAFFNEAAHATFDRVLSARTSARDVQRALTRSADEHRLLVWSRHADEQSLLTETELSGAATSSTRGDHALGVFLDDGTGGKMDYYLRTSARLVSSTCTNGARTDTVRVTLRSTAPKDARRSLPSYVTGEASRTVTPGVIRTNVAVYTPVGAQLPVLTRGDRSVGASTFDALDRTLTQISIDLAPGASSVTDVTMTTPASALRSGPLELWTTPTTTTSGLAALDVASCG